LVGAVMALIGAGVHPPAARSAPSGIEERRLAPGARPRRAPSRRGDHASTRSPGLSERARSSRRHTASRTASRRASAVGDSAPSRPGAGSRIQLRHPHDALATPNCASKVA
jgi:hypothetical protein